jgi:hypothetical protein
MDKKDEEIQRKLLELESTVLKESQAAQQHLVPARESSPELIVNRNNQTPIIKNELCYFSGIGLILTGVLMFFNHVRLGSGFLAMFGFGGGGFGLLLIPLMIGIGWIIYNSKSKIGWLVTAASGAVIFFAVLSSLIMTFPQMSLLGLVLMLLPFAAGVALVLKGMGGPKSLQENK